MTLTKRENSRSSCYAKWTTTTFNVSFHFRSMFYFYCHLRLDTCVWYTRVYATSFRTGCQERELKMIQPSATRCGCVAILLVIQVSFAAITLCVASQRVCCCLFRYRLSPETFGYTVVLTGLFPKFRDVWSLRSYEAFEIRPGSNLYVWFLLPGVIEVSGRLSLHESNSLIDEVMLSSRKGR